MRQYADQLAGMVVVDITNPVDTQTWDRLATQPGRSSAEETQQLRRAQQLEQLGLLHLAIQQPLGLNFASAVRLHP